MSRLEIGAFVESIARADLRGQRLIIWSYNDAYTWLEPRYAALVEHLLVALVLVVLLRRCGGKNGM